jgi:UDP-GlcNAc:undecaprenyl-phosphate GlcNAc-1-phosphate transferase
LLLLPAGFIEPHTITLAFAFFCPFALSWLFTASLIRWAPRLGLVDYPSARKVHSQPTPRGGGLAIFAAFLVTWLFASGFSLRDPRLPLGLVIVVLGLADDLRPLPWQVRLGVQLIVATWAVLTCVPVVAWWLRLLAIVWVAGLINAFNMLDNMDALSGGVAWIAAGFLALTVALRRQMGLDVPTETVLPYLHLMGALSGFLWFNWPPARIFMGDAGSTFLGFFLGLGSVETALETGGPPWTWAVPLCICAVPCYDLLSVVTIRLRQGRSPFHADKQHLSHRLVKHGFSSPGAVRLIHLLALASGAAGLLLYAVASATGAVLVGVQLAAWWVALAVIEYAGRERSAPSEQRLADPRPQGDRTAYFCPADEDRTTRTER